MTRGFIEDDFDNLVKKVDSYMTAIVMTFVIGCCMFFLLRAI